MGGLKGVISVIIMAVTSLNPNGIALGIQNIADKLKLLLDVLTKVQQKSNESVQIETQQLLTGDINTDNEAILGMVAKLNDLITKRTQLYSDNKKAAAAEADATVQRYNNEINKALDLEKQLEKLGEKYQNLNNLLSMSKQRNNLSGLYQSLADKNNYGYYQVDAINKALATPEQYGLNQQRVKAIRRYIPEGVNAFEIPDLEKKISAVMRSIKGYIKRDLDKINQEFTSEKFNSAIKQTGIKEADQQKILDKLKETKITYEDIINGNEK